MKKLIINPSKEESKNLTIIKVPRLVVDLLEKVLRTNESNFNKLVTKDQHTKTFINNIQYKLVTIQDFSGKELNSMQEAVDFYNEVANKIYGKFWMVELIKNEIRFSKNADFGVYTVDPELAKYIEKRLSETDSNVTILYGTQKYSIVNEEDKPNKNNKLNAKKEEKENDR